MSHYPGDEPPQIPQNPYGSPAPESGAPPPISWQMGMPQDARQYAVQLLKVPAIILIVLAALSIVLDMWGVVNSVIEFREMQDISEFERDLDDAEMDAEVREQMRTFVPAFIRATGIGAVLTNLVHLIAQIVIITGAVNMLQVRSRGMAITGSIVSLIPCFGASCCMLSIPFGIWALVVLNDATVKAAFQQSRA